MDQAHILREYMLRFNEQQQHPSLSRVITVTSGKGGVGKSNFTLNFALGLKASGKKVVILDCDFSAANINILMGVFPRYGLADIMNQRKTIWETIEKGVNGIEYIYGGLELEDLEKLNPASFSYFWDQVQMLQTYCDFILLDTGAGISKHLVDFILASDETMLITTPEPTSVADAYGVLKAVAKHSKETPSSIRLVVNKAQSYRDGLETSRALKNTCRKFLKMNLNTLGFILEDPHVSKAVRSQQAFSIAFPKTEASRNIKEIVRAYLPDSDKGAPPKGLRRFFEKVIAMAQTR
ncbi:MinD/ParA family protein [Pullulanibacillus sp. KACC 23026]|uniref:MinD/ParA family protein n=1 Tax=Pullulanibacillus sp. KACC 23026 TaxID=3028315 RepID=UPI0023B13322|nr:MinD/ParA family protein [Pullulanibacillus sp. KACC 23026]WEG11224.1 MinD/ParA family protein [Pullulanibacillus sp. KACC 23026]